LWLSEFALCIFRGGGLLRRSSILLPFFSDRSVDFQQSLTKNSRLINTYWVTLVVNVAKWQSCVFTRGHYQGTPVDFFSCGMKLWQP
jgi:hypothetical protein